MPPKKSAVRKTAPKQTAPKKSAPRKSAPRELAPLALTLDQLAKPTPAQEQALLDAAARLWTRKPWKTLVEDEIFVVVAPADGQLLFVSVLGRGGEQAGVVVYRGADAYFGLLDFTARAAQLPALPEISDEMPDAAELMEQLMGQLSQLHFDPMELLQLSQLQLMFEPRQELSELDQAWLKQHKYQASGRGYPTFRSIVPGFLPWWIDAEEAAILIVALEQLERLLEREEFSPALFQARETGGNKPARELFARVPKTEANGEITWSDARLKVSAGELLRIEIAPDQATMERIAALAIGADIVEMELVSMPTPIGGQDDRPCFPSLLLTGENQMVSGMETIPCGPGPHRLPLLLDAILRLLDARKTRPKTIQFASPDLTILSFVGETLGIGIEAVEELPTLDPALESLMEHMENVGEPPEAWDDDDPKNPPTLH